MIWDEGEERPVVSHRRIHTGAVFALDQDLVRLHADEPPARRDYLAHPGAVGIVALRQRAGQGEPEVCLVKQYRHPVRMKLWEIPAGLLDKPGEPMVEAAKRELAEEADLRADTWHTLVDVYTSPGASSERLRVFLARDVTPIEGGSGYRRSEEERDMQQAWVPLSRAVAAVHAGQMHNPSAIVGVLAASGILGGADVQLRDADAPWAG